jgi:hypothetical protein
MTITSDPNDPEFRKALREIGAPDWFPQDAPRHQIQFEAVEDNSFVTMRCPICGWEKRVYQDGTDRFENIKDGDPWTLHEGSSLPDLMNITSLEVTVKQDDEERLKPFEDFLNQDGC